MLKDSGKRTTYQAGAMKEPTGGRGRYDLVPTRALRRVAKHYENGADKYDDRNWEAGIPYMKMVDSLKRHLDQWVEQETDEDHLAACAFWILGLMHFEETERDDLDDRPNYKPN